MRSHLLDHPPRTRGRAASSALRALGSLRLTLAILALLGAMVAWAYAGGREMTWPLVVPLALFALNLLAAVLSREVFRRQMPLLAFHLGLLALIVLIAAGRLSYLRGTLELTEGIPFDGTLSSHEAGPWHPWHLEQVPFVNAGFDVVYAEGLQRRETRNRVRWSDSGGTTQEQVIGDQYPLVRDGYRFYTTSNKGFAPVFRWQPHGGPASVGSVHLPSYPLNEYRQSTEWQPPGSELQLWTLLAIDEPLIPIDAPGRFRLPERHHVVVRHGEQRAELAPGQSLSLPGGRLHYLGLSTWMGYQVFYDRTIPWLLAAAAFSVLSLGWHFWQRFTRRPWHQPEGDACRPEAAQG